MIHDPEFGGIEEKEPAKPGRPRWFRWIVIYPFLVFAGCRALMTGIPVPLVHIERLDHPVRVVEVGDRALILEGGAEARLPFLKRLPKGDPRFAEALSYGIEIDPAGEVWGLIDSRPKCGNDPVIHYRHRVNLSDLAGALDPRLLDEALIGREAIDFLARDAAESRQDRREMPWNIQAKVAEMRRILRAGVGEGGGSKRAAGR